MKTAAPGPYALTGMLTEIAELVGLDLAVAVAREYGGQRLYVRHELTAANKLARLVGIKAARIIAAHLGGKRYEVPSSKAFLHWWDARALRRQGKSYGEIARAIKVSHKHARTLCADLDEFAEAAASMRAADELHESPRACPVCGHRHRVPARPDPRQFTFALGS
jgi:hypothetical protein